MGNPRHYDVIIVGARCAGASLAVHLRRAGRSVLLVDAASLPCDQPMSTHLIQPPGMAELDELGVGNRVRGLSPAIVAAKFDIDGQEMLLRYGSIGAAHCLRRAKLDGFLLDAATAASAELRTRTRIVSVERDADGRVRGAGIRNRSGRVEQIAADLVVGADGRHSAVARLVGAEEYLGYDGPRASYWAYWRRPAAWDPALLLNAFHEEHARVLFPTDEDHVLVASAPPVSDSGRWRNNHAAAYVSDVRSCPPLAAMFANDQPVSPVRALPKARYFLRVSAGPGWALVGDAGHHKEFVIGFGISDALRDARSLASAIVEGTDASLDRYCRKRDVERIEMYRWAKDAGRVKRTRALDRLVAGRVAASPETGDRFGDVVGGRISPYALFPARQVACWAIGAGMRGDLRPAIEFLATARRAIAVRFERRRRQRLLDSVLRDRSAPAIEEARDPASAYGNHAVIIAGDGSVRGHAQCRVTRRAVVDRSPSVSGQPSAAHRNPRKYNRKFGGWW